MKFVTPPMIHGFVPYTALSNERKAETVLKEFFSFFEGAVQTAEEHVEITEDLYQDACSEDPEGYEAKVYKELLRQEEGQLELHRGRLAQAKDMLRRYGIVLDDEDDEEAGD